LARGARDLIAKIAASVPASLRPILLDAGLKPIFFKPIARERFDVSELRGAIRDQRKATIDYEDAERRISTRVIWPIFIAYMEEVRILVAWCESRRDFRHFRTDRIRSLQVMEDRCPERASVLRNRWKESQKSGSSARDMASSDARASTDLRPCA